MCQLLPSLPANDNDLVHDITVPNSYYLINNCNHHAAYSCITCDCEWNSFCFFLSVVSTETCLECEDWESFES